MKKRLRLYTTIVVLAAILGLGTDSLQRRCGYYAVIYCRWRGLSYDRYKGNVKKYSLPKLTLEKKRVTYIRWLVLG